MIRKIIKDFFQNDPWVHRIKKKLIFEFLQYEVAKAALYHEIPVVLVRTKSDVELQNIKEKIPQNEFQAQKLNYRNEVLADFRRQLPREVERWDIPMFVISSRVIQGVPRCRDFELDESPLMAYLIQTAESRRGIYEF